MDDHESLKLLIDSGVPDEMIDGNALDLASFVGDEIIETCTKTLVQRIIETELPKIMHEESMRYRWRQLGINVEG